MSALCFLLEAWLAGEHCEFAIHDCLLEMGLPNVAAFHFGSSPCRADRCEVALLYRVSFVRQPQAGERWFSVVLAGKESVGGAYWARGPGLCNAV